MITLSSSLIHLPWSRLPSSNSVGHASSRSWTCGVPITLFVSGKATSGRQGSLPPQATMNIGSCHMAFPTLHPPPVCHCLHRRFIDLLQEHGRTSPLWDAGPMPTREAPSLPEAREMSSTAPQSSSSATVRIISRWTRGRSKPSVTCPSLSQ